MRLIYLICLLASCTKSVNFLTREKGNKRDRDSQEVNDGRKSPTTEGYLTAIENGTINLKLKTEDDIDKFDQFIATYNGPPIVVNRNSRDTLEKTTFFKYDELKEMSITYEENKKRQKSNNTLRNPFAPDVFGYIGEFDEDNIDLEEEEDIKPKIVIDKKLEKLNLSEDKVVMAKLTNIVEGREKGNIHPMKDADCTNVRVGNKRVYYSLEDDQLQLKGFNKNKNKDRERKSKISAMKKRNKN